MLVLVAVIALVIRVRPSRGSDVEPPAPVAAAVTPAVVVPRVATPASPIDAGEPEAGRVAVQATVGGLPIIGTGPCRMTVVATPAGSTVQLDGAELGPTPLTIDGPCQRRRVDIAHDRYQPAMRWVTPSAGKPETIDVTLTRPTHAVTVVTQPAGATVMIDGRRAGTTPTVIQIMGFQSMSLTVEKPGFQPVTQRVYSKLANDRVVIKLPSKLFPVKRR